MARAHALSCMRGHHTQSSGITTRHHGGGCERTRALCLQMTRGRQRPAPQATATVTVKSLEKILQWISLHQSFRKDLEFLHSQRVTSVCSPVPRVLGPALTVNVFPGQRTTCSVFQCSGALRPGGSFVVFRSINSSQPLSRARLVSTTKQELPTPASQRSVRHAHTTDSVHCTQRTTDIAPQKIAASAHISDYTHRFVVTLGSEPQTLRHPYALHDARAVDQTGYTDHVPASLRYRLRHYGTPRTPTRADNP